MPKLKEEPKRRKRPPATTPEERENQMIAKAMDLAEKQLDEGTASTQVITHFLKLGSTREAAEQEMMAKKTELVSSQISNLESQRRSDEVYVNALNAFRSYTGHKDDEEIIL